mmetsp:Transcript_113733/g.157387  ORF Transcript_113733/g.157387 Transcript_113733/m.157387 type:complete len:293 (-) Transcript_113733:90-968(-)
MAHASTSFLRATMSALLARPASKSFNFLPFSACTFRQIWQHLSRNSAIFLKSSWPQPRVVIAGAPMRTPPGERAEASPCTALRFSEMDASSQTFSTLEPVKPCGLKSQSTRWLSVPSLASLWPFDLRVSARTFALTHTFFEYSLNSGVSTSRSCAARPPIWWLWGPPCRPGKTAMSIRSLMSGILSPYLKKIMPARGPRRDLCVVVVTTSQCSNGAGWLPVATRPEMWAMSAIKSAPTSSAISLNLAKSTTRGYAEAPHRIMAGRNTRADLRSSSKSIRPVSWWTLYGSDSK